MNRFFENSNNINNDNTNNDNTNDDLAELLPDYINGHLDADTTARLKNALATDQNLRAQYDFQARLRIALRVQAELADSKAQLNSIQGVSGFSAIADRLEESAGERWLSWFGHWLGLRGAGGFSLTALAPVFALVLAVGLFAGTNLGDVDLTINSYHTETSVETFDQPTLRIITQAGMETTALVQLLGDYDLQLEHYLLDSRMAEVTPVVPGEDLTRLLDALLKDDRVVFAKVVSGRTDPDRDSR